MGYFGLDYEEFTPCWHCGSTQCTGNHDIEAGARLAHHANGFGREGCCRVCDNMRERRQDKPIPPDAEPPAPNDPAAGNPRLTSPPPGGSPLAARPRLFPVNGPGFEGAVLADDDADAERRARAFGPDAEVVEVVWMSSSEAMPVTTRRRG